MNAPQPRRCFGVAEEMLRRGKPPSTRPVTTVKRRPAHLEARATATLSRRRATVRAGEQVPQRRQLGQRPPSSTDSAASLEARSGPPRPGGEDGAAACAALPGTGPTKRAPQACAGRSLSVCRSSARGSRPAAGVSPSLVETSSSPASATAPRASSYAFSRCGGRSCSSYGHGQRPGWRAVAARAPSVLFHLLEERREQVDHGAAANVLAAAERRSGEAVRPGTGGRLGSDRRIGSRCHAGRPGPARRRRGGRRPHSPRRTRPPMRRSRPRTAPRARRAVEQ